MRVSLQPLARVVDGRLAAEGADVSLWCGEVAWRCRDALLAARVLAAEPIALPAAEPSEPVPSALARLVAALRGQRALLLLLQPSIALGVERIGLAEGVRLFAIADERDVPCWDRALTLGLPVYGVRGAVVCDLLRPTPENLLSALGYGAFHCAEGLIPIELAEDPMGVRWRLSESGEAAVIVRGGFEAQRQRGVAGEWRDGGGEGYVRIEITTPKGRCWTQPRFIAPRRGGDHGG
jgi:hypothetical protein